MCPRLWLAKTPKSSNQLGRFPTSEFLFEFTADFESQHVAPRLGDDLDVDGQAVFFGAADHSGGHFGDVPGHGVAEAFEVAGLYGFSVFERRLRVDGRENSVVVP